MMAHDCKAEKSHGLGIIFTGKFGPLAAVRSECKNGRAYKVGPNETLDREVTVNTLKKDAYQRWQLWDALSKNPKTKRDIEEVGTLVYAPRSYGNASKHLGIFVRDNDWTPYEYTALNSAPAADFELFCKTVGVVIGDDAEKAQRKTLSPEGRAAWDKERAKPEKKESAPLPEPKLPALKPLELPRPSKPISAKEITTKVVILNVTKHSIGNHKKIRTSAIDMKDKDTDKNRVNVSKKLIDAPEFEAMTSKYGEITRYLENVALPSLIKRGIYMLNKDKASEVDERLIAYNVEVRKLAILLSAAWSRILGDSERDLASNFDLRDYLTADEVREAFYIEYGFFRVSAPDPAQIEPKIWKREAAKIEENIREAGRVADALLQAEFTERVKRLIERLTPDEKGKAKIVRDTFIPNVKEWLDTFDSKNINNNVQLQVLVDRAKQLVSGVDTDILRQSNNAREYLRNGFAEVDKLLDSVVVDKPRRAISFDDV